MSIARHAFVATAALALFSAPAHADRFALEYDGNLFGIAPLGGITFDISTGANDYDVKATMRTGGVLRWFEKTDIAANAEGRIVDGAVRWERYFLDHLYSGKRRQTAMQLNGGVYSAEITPIYRDWGEPPATEEDRVTSRDPLSSLAAMAVDVARTRTCTGAYATFDGLTRYDLVLTGGEVRKFEAGGYEGPALKCRMRYVQLRGFNPSNPNERRRQPEGEIWFALAEDSNVAPPVRVVIPTPFGRAGIHLKKWRRASVEIEAPEAPKM
jgi:hypothetical protein